ncbi:V-type ATPase subunit [Candidatus Micrarchaeota archaeon]|nr:V-type ATPase subunit [Candidatus Micrarchaeota archaeon]
MGLPKLPFPRIYSKALVYGYANARIKAMKGLLLSSSSLNDLIRVGSIEGMAELLQKTGYKNELSAAALNNSGSRLIDVAASRNFVKVAKKILKITPTGDRKALQALLLRWDLSNLKTIMHARKLGLPFDEVEPNLFEVGALTEDEFKKLMRADEGSIGKELKRTEIGKQLMEQSGGNAGAGEKFKKALSSTDGFIGMENVIDSSVYDMMDRQLERAGGKELNHIRNILKKEIDSKNIMIIERLKKRNADRKKIMSSLIVGGTIKESILAKLAETKDLTAVVPIIKSRFRNFTLKEGANLTELEIALEKAIAHEKLSAFNRAILSVGVIVGFMMLKEEEVNNLRKIGKGKEFALSENDVKEMLVVI